MDLTDYAGTRLTYGKPKVNGVEIHYAMGGAGGAGVLAARRAEDHGVPAAT
jgi:hypothetical protein